MQKLRHLLNASLGTNDHPALPEDTKATSLFNT